MSARAVKVGITLFCLIGSLALADAAYQVYRVVDDSHMHCGIGLAGNLCRSLRHGLVHVRLVATVEALAIAVVALLIAGTLAWLRHRRSSAARDSPLASRQA